MRTDAQVYAGATALGVVAGMRTMSAPALISRAAQMGQLGSNVAPVAFLGSKAAAGAIGLLALGELVADKLPGTPSRTRTGPLVARLLAGAFSGAVLSSARKRSAWLGAMYGAMGALGSTFAAYHLRRSAGESFQIPDTVLAALEDAAVISGLWLISRQLEQE